MTAIPAPLPHNTAALGASYTTAVFGRRIVALILDLIVLSLVDLVVNAVFGVAHITGGSVAPIASGSVVTFASATDIGWLGLTLVMIGYFAVPEALFGATLGKWWMGLRVTDLAGRSPTVLAVLVRNLLRPLDALIFGYLIGAAFALTSPRRQRLGDRVARTIVVASAARARPARSPAALRWRVAALGIGLVAALIGSGLFAYYGRPPLVIQGWRNTDTALFEDGVSSYTLGPPRWGDGTVTYAVRYVPYGSHPRTCTGTVTLRWADPFDGWQMANAFTYCPSAG